MRADSKEPDCHDQVCITCSDLATEARVISLLENDFARVQVGDAVEVVSIALVDAHPGDLILIHAREAIAKLTQ
ncbi:MAG: hypothetical protein JWM69_571 [Candidatus Binatus sp.]|jgi:hypothetical protein|nr:hypothetical protein [Candidatus Binatus sp.]